MFTHTCTRELFMTFLIKNLLDVHSIPIANTPIGNSLFFSHVLGWWEYKVSYDTFPNVAKCCALFETIGDKRLSDHGLVGLERLLPRMCLPPKFEDLSKHFPSSRINEDNSIIETWIASLTQEFGTLSHACLLQIEERIPEVPTNIEEHLKIQWQDTCSKMEEKLELTKKKCHIHNLFAYVYWRLGRETGEILRILHQNEISWGTYDDLLGMHCNAHPNNLVLIPESGVCLRFVYKCNVTI